MYRNHGTGSGGTAGFFQYTFHGTSTDRAGNPSGTVTLDGAVVNSGATLTGGELWSSKSGSVVVMICRPKLPC